MPETLDHLIDRIREEGIEQADKEARERLAAAEKQATQILDEARQQAEDLVAKARTEAEQLDQRGRTSLEQAARDALLTVAKAIETVFEELARRALAEALDRDTLRDLLKTVVNRYFGESDQPGQVTVLVAKDEFKTVEKLLMAEFGAALKKGLSVGADDELTGGFRVALKDDHVFHDFSREAMADLLCSRLRPELAAITRKALDGKD